MLGRLRDAVADVRDAGSNATRWLGIDELAQAAAYAGSGNESWRVVGARTAVAEEPELECNAAAVECSISGGVRGHAALQALEQFAAARQASHARGEWSSAAAPLADAATARPRRWPLTPDEDRRLDEPAADGVDSALSALAALAADGASHDDETARAYESLRRALNADAAEANASPREAHHIANCQCAAPREPPSHSQPSAARPSCAPTRPRGRASEDADDARRATEAAEANARAEVPQDVARAAALARDRARTHERRCGARAREREAVRPRARRSSRGGGWRDPGPRPKRAGRGRGRCRAARACEVRSRRRASWVPSAPSARAGRAASDARRLKLDALDAALDAAEARAEPPRPPPTRVAKALGLLRDAARRREAGDIHTGAGPALETDVDAALRSLFSDADANPGAAIAAARRNRRDGRGQTPLVDGGASTTRRRSSRA